MKVWKRLKRKSKCEHEWLKEQKTKQWNINFYLCIEELVVSLLFTIYYLPQDAMLCMNKNNHPFKYMYYSSCTLLEDDPWDSVDIIFQKSVVTNSFRIFSSVKQNIPHYWKKHSLVLLINTIFTLCLLVTSQNKMSLIQSCDIHLY